MQVTRHTVPPKRWWNQLCGSSLREKSEDATEVETLVLILLSRVIVKEFRVTPSKFRRRADTAPVPDFGRGVELAREERLHRISPGESALMAAILKKCCQREQDTKDRMAGLRTLQDGFAVQILSFASAW